MQIVTTVHLQFYLSVRKHSVSIDQMQAIWNHKSYPGGDTIWQSILLITQSILLPALNRLLGIIVTITYILSVVAIK